eukprot:2173291-Rhodomonas_salina.7
MVVAVLSENAVLTARREVLTLPIASVSPAPHRVGARQPIVTHHRNRRAHTNKTSSVSRIQKQTDLCPPFSRASTHPQRQPCAPTPLSEPQLCIRIATDAMPIHSSQPPTGHEYAQSSRAQHHPEHTTMHSTCQGVREPGERPVLEEERGPGEGADAPLGYALDALGEAEARQGRGGARGVGDAPQALNLGVEGGERVAEQGGERGERGGRRLRVRHCNLPDAVDGGVDGERAVAEQQHAPPREHRQ